ncbi:hypothetical protein AGDE_04518 [Angomonas deanei]|uniref:Tim10/DDP family zinc finger containing protein, putative n=1 Tax=Angomonas deanei TaxID=59799 RepID=A0A7G2CB81_9TRYP|nr:hypothetical protein AGDE_04518 [Angomonas deanei]CAD2217038.1 Tim10/DDP family zinc finger containing protein, putative [Angomonas deanei]|eukprot:EPY39410.1 hypothetical protein AGDE_04518 [Angomonas deanei]
MQTQFAIYQAVEQFSMLDLMNHHLANCWDICYEKNLTAAELVASLPDEKTQQMDACGRKCMARHFEVMRMLVEATARREKEEMLQLEPGSLSH